MFPSTFIILGKMFIETASHWKGQKQFSNIFTSESQLNMQHSSRTELNFKLYLNTHFKHVNK